MGARGRVKRGAEKGREMWGWEGKRGMGVSPINLNFHAIFGNDYVLKKYNQ